MNKNTTPHEGKVKRKQRWKLNKHKTALVWLTGLPGSGKSTISHELEYRLFQRRIKTYVLDGDNVRQGLCKDLGFSAEDRRENLRRVGEAAGLFLDAGILTVAAFASPYRADRFMVRRMFGPCDFIEVYLKCDLKVCEARDPKGLYKKARSGEIKNFTGVSDPYEPPENPEIVLDTDRLSIEESVSKIMDYL
ncbi:MAG: adenylyl-sulfate kinase, partial [Thermodesulfovibrionales bacterium]